MAFSAIGGTLLKPVGFLPNERVLRFEVTGYGTYTASVTATHASALSSTTDLTWTFVK